MHIDRAGTMPRRFVRLLAEEGVGSLQKAPRLQEQDFAELGTSYFALSESFSKRSCARSNEGAISSAASVCFFASAIWPAARCASASSTYAMARSGGFEPRTLLNDRTAVAASL